MAFVYSSRMKSLRQAGFWLMAAIIFLLYSPTLLDFRPQEYSLPFSPFTGPLEINDKLGATEHLFQGSIRGPESIVIHNGDLLTGLEDGSIVRIKDNKMYKIAHTGQECNLPHEERLCGRPLGMRLGHDGYLYILDGFYGLYRMNLTTRMLTRILSSNVVVDGRRITFPDDLDIDKDGDVYLSDASAKWGLAEIYYLIGEYEGTGRVIRFNMYTGETEVILRDLYFPNGIQISHDKNSLLICEISRRRVLRYYLKGQRKGELEVFVDKLPGEPDNIRPSSRGGYWVALAMARNESNPMILDRTSRFPQLRRIFGRIQHGLGTLLMAVADVLSSYSLKQFAYRLRRGDILLSLLPSHGMILELDANGNILRSLQDPAGKTSHLSQVTEHEGYLYLGSFLNPYLGKLKL